MSLRTTILITLVTASLAIPGNAKAHGGGKQHLHIRNRGKQLRNRANKLCVSLGKPRGKKAGTALKLLPCKGEETQRWRIRRLNKRGNWVQLVNQNSGCMANSSAKKSRGLVNGTRVVSRSCLDHPTQRWSLIQVAGKGTLLLVNQYSGLCLSPTLSRADNADKSSVQLWACSGKAIQQFFRAY